MSRHAKAPEIDPTTIAVLHEAGDSVRVLVVDVGEDPARILTAETVRATDATGLGACLDRHHVGRVIHVLSAGGVICRTCTLPAAAPEQLAQALSLQAEAALLGVAPEHRVGMAVLASAPGETSRSGIVTAWPTSAAGPSVTVPEHEHRVVTYASEIAGIAALLDGLRPSHPLVWIDRGTGAVAAAITHSGGAVFRATREAADSTDAWTAAVGRVLAETALNVGHTSAFVEGMIEAASARLAHVTPGGAMLIAPSELVEQAAASCLGTRDGEDWWSAYGIGVGVAIAAAGDLADLCVLERDRVEETPSRIEAIATALSEPRIAIRTAVVCVLLVALMPLVSSGLRLGILKLRHAEVEQRVQAVRDMHRSVALYDALEDAAWPMAKILADVVSNTPQGIELSMIRLNQADGGFSVSGVALPHDGRNATEVVAQMHRQLRDSNIFGDIGLNWGDPTAYGHYQFDLTAKVERPHRPSRYEIDLDFARWPLAYRQAKLGPPDAEDEAPATGTEQVLASATSGSDTASANPGAGAPFAFETPSGATPSSGPDDPGSRPDRNGRPVRRGPDGTGEASGGNRGDQGDRQDATVAEFAIPEALTQAQVDAMTTEQVRQEVTVRAEARRRARASGDEVLEQRLKTEFDMLMDRLRGGG